MKEVGVKKSKFYFMYPNLIFLTVFYIPLWLFISVIIAFIIFFICGYYFIKKHNQREKDRRNIENEINRIGK
jgi:predicted membrane protein